MIKDDWLVIINIKGKKTSPSSMEYNIHLIKKKEEETQENYISSVCF